MSSLSFFHLPEIRHVWRAAAIGNPDSRGKQVTRTQLALSQEGHQSVGGASHTRHRASAALAPLPAQCKCGAETAVIGYDESERLDVEPAKSFVTVTRREKRACRNCKKGGVATAPVAAEIVEKGWPATGW